MVKRKLPADAFNSWVSLGDGRTFVEVARRFGVDKATVTRAARRERWRERLEDEVAPKVEERVQQQVIEDLAAVRLRQAQLGKTLQEKGLEALRRFPIADVKDAIKAIQVGAKVESDAREMNSTKRTDSRIEVVLRERFEKLVSAPQPKKLTDGHRPRLKIAYPSVEELEEEVGGE